MKPLIKRAIIFHFIFLFSSFVQAQQCLNRIDPIIIDQDTVIQKGNFLWLHTPCNSQYPMVNLNSNLSIKCTEYYINAQLLTDEILYIDLQAHQENHYTNPDFFINYAFSPNDISQFKHYATCDTPSAYPIFACPKIKFTANYQKDSIHIQLSNTALININTCAEIKNKIGELIARLPLNATSIAYPMQLTEPTELTISISNGKETKIESFNFKP